MTNTRVAKKGLMQNRKSQRKEQEKKKTKDDEEEDDLKHGLMILKRTELMTFEEIKSARSLI